MLLFRALTLTVLGNQGIGPFPDEVRTLANGFTDGYLGNVGLGPLGGADLFTPAGRRWRRSPAIVVTQWRARAGAAAATARRSTRCRCSCCKIALAAAVIVFVVVQLARFKNLPWVLVLLAVAGARLLAADQPRRVRPADLRHRRQPAGGGAVRRQGQVGRRSGSSSTWACWPRSPGSSSPAGSTRPGPTAGNAFELDAIAAAFIGGAAVQGGVGKVVGAITGGLIMAVINNGMSLIGAPSERVMLVKGAGAARRRRLRRVDQAPRRHGRALTRPAVRLRARLRTPAPRPRAVRTARAGPPRTGPGRCCPGRSAPAPPGGGPPPRRPPCGRAAAGTPPGRPRRSPGEPW